MRPRPQTHASAYEDHDDSHLCREWFAWIVLPMFNFFFWFGLARTRAYAEGCSGGGAALVFRDTSGDDAPGGARGGMSSAALPCGSDGAASSAPLRPASLSAPGSHLGLPSSSSSSSRIVRRCRTPYPAFPATHLETMPSLDFDQYRADRMGSMNYPYDAGTHPNPNPNPNP